MSITDELREWYKDRAFLGNGYAELTAIADRIDAEHQKALDEWKAKHGQMWLKGYSECHAELLEGNETLASDLERCGWTRLPKDADGVPIHIGDVMDLTENVCNLTVLGIGIMDANESRYGVFVREGHDYVWYNAEFLHHHAPTVEDVLREFADGIKDQNADFTELAIAEYAKRLKLAEEDA